MSQNIALNPRIEVLLLLMQHARESLRDYGKEAIRLVTEEWIRLGVAPSTEEEYERLIKHDGLHSELYSTTNLPHGVNVLAVSRPDIFDGRIGLLVRDTEYEEHERIGPFIDDAHKVPAYSEGPYAYTSDCYWIELDDISEPEWFAISVHDTMHKLLFDRNRN